LASLLSGPIDVDKMDYLVRDSLHAGVPYGRNFDANRLIGSLCIHPQQPQVAVTAKGRTAAEMMVFARYVMFSEVYWHHSVRSATAMLQRSLFLLGHRLDLHALNRLDESAWVARVRRMAEGTLAEPLVEGIFGPRRLLWKRVAEFNQQEQPELHASLARRPYRWLVACSEAVAARLSRQIGSPLSAADVLIDAPPVGLEVDVDVAVVSRQGEVRPLANVSPVVEALAHHQFDNFVKRVRVFVRPEIRASLPHGRLPLEFLREAVAVTDEAWSET
jgi:HD superfamily phosphohydrolase